MTKRTRWILVNFNNCTDIHKLISLYEDVCKFIVVDNSKDYIQCSNEVIITPDDNVGYIGGFKLAVKSLDNHSQYKLIFSNSDIEIVDGITEFIEGDQNEGTVLIPRIISPNGEQNPHIFVRKKKVYWVIRFVASKNNFFWYLWNLLVNIRKNDFYRFKPRKLLASQNVYAGHGSFFIFNCIDFSEFNIGTHNFLYGEEVHLAEYFYAKGIAVFFNPSLVVQHIEHTSTSFLKNNVRRSFFHDSYKSIISKYYI